MEFFPKLGCGYFTNSLTVDPETAEKSQDGADEPRKRT